MKFRTEAERIKYEEDYRPAYNALMTCYPFTLDDLDDEIWKPIAGYEEFYHVSNYGRIKSFKRKKPIILTPALNQNGYLRVHLSLDGKKKNFFVHILVATAFIPNPDNKPEVNHRIGWKLNCYVGNLEWSTREENQQHAVDNGLNVAKKGEECYQAKLTNEQVLYIRNNPDNLTQDELAEMFGMKQATISEIQTGKSYTDAGGSIRKSKCPRVADEIRDKIRADWATGNFTYAALARKYGVDRKTIWNIINEV